MIMRLFLLLLLLLLIFLLSNIFVQQQIGEEARRHKLLIDREGMTAALGSIADAHMLLIQTRDDTMQAQMSNWLTSFFDGKHKDLLQRNRRRIIEIKDLSEKISAEINALAVTKEGDAEDEDD